MGRPKGLKIKGNLIIKLQKNDFSIILSAATKKAHSSFSIENQVFVLNLFL